MSEHRSWAYAPGIIVAWWRRRRKPKSPLRRMLTHADFCALVMGEEVEQDGVIIALADIGFDQMGVAVSAAYHRQLERER